MRATMLRPGYCSIFNFEDLLQNLRKDTRFFACPTSAAYVSWIVYGLRQNGVPEDYISHVVEVARETKQIRMRLSRTA
jgi:hypothetical protein